jgi:hypothetical protein
LINKVFEHIGRVTRTLVAIRDSIDTVSMVVDTILLGHINRAHVGELWGRTVAVIV